MANGAPSSVDRSDLDNAIKLIAVALGFEFFSSGLTLGFSGLPGVMHTVYRLGRLRLDHMTHLSVHKFNKFRSLCWPTRLALFYEVQSLKFRT